MKKTQKRAFILNECKSPYISQAIFILKDGVSSNHVGVVADAERIVASYMTGTSKETPHTKLSPPLISAISALISAALCSTFFLFIIK